MENGVPCSAPLFLSDTKPPFNYCGLCSSFAAASNILWAHLVKLKSILLQIHKKYLCKAQFFFEIIFCINEVKIV
jgi:hypothetical protein